MTIDILKTELEKTVNDFASAGFGSVAPAMLAKLDELSALAGDLNMKEGKRLIVNLSSAIKDKKEEKSRIESCNVRLEALDFYVKKLSAHTNIEDL